MDSEEFLDFIGHNYVISQPILALSFIDHHIFLAEAAQHSQWSSETARHIQHETPLILDGGSERIESGPSQGAASSKSSNINSKPSRLSPQTTLVTPQPLNDNIEHATSTEPIAHSDNNTQTQAGPNGTWSSIVTKNVPITEARNSENAQIIFNKDGSATFRPPKTFLSNARKIWVTSIIGHFIGGSFNFIFVRDQAFKFLKNMGLSRFFYSLKEYFIFKFDSVKVKNEVLALNSVQMGALDLSFFGFQWDEFGNKELMKVTFIYPQLLGHSFSRCVNNPNAVKPVPRQRQDGAPNTKAPRANNKGKS
ncbi:hypothetical protein AgCh_028413 [Apium graveolens]